MRIAIKRDDTVIGPEGTVTGHEAGDTLVRRLIRVFEHPIVIGPIQRRCEGFDEVPLEFLDPAEAVVVNMDVADSPHVFAQLADRGAPRIMNFVWRPVPSDGPIERTAAFALSCALFPTFADAQRTAGEVRDLVERWTVSRLAAQSHLAWVNLGFRLDHVQPRRATDAPIVLYPAIYLSRAKRPDVFFEVVERVRHRVPLTVEMRLHESHLVSEQAMRLSGKDWVRTGPLTATRTSYWEALARTTAFLATAEEESYGLLYVEALGAGVVGVLPDRDWARELVPEGYPFLYRDQAEAERMLTRALREPDACRAEIDQSADGSFGRWIAENHSDDAFDKAIVARVAEWFGE